MAASGLLFRIIILVIILIIIPIAITKAQTQSFECPRFSSTCIKHLKLEGSASTTGSAIQLTEDNAMDLSTSFGSAGRVTYAERINLRDKNSNEQRDFITNFSFVVSSSNQSIYGGGLVFFLASRNLPSTDRVGGSFGVGLTDGYLELFQLGYRFLGVEFVTFRNPFHQPDAEVAINIINMKSRINERWRIHIAQGKVCNCSIVYDSRNSILNVSYTGYKIRDGKVKKTTQYLSYSVDIRQELPDSVVVGISAATGVFSEQHKLLSWSFSTTPPSDDEEKEIKAVIITLEGIGIGAVLFLSLFGMVMISLRMMAKRKEVGHTSDPKRGDELEMSTGPKKIRYHELATATNNFDETNKLGQGGFGGVYKGYFKDSNTYAAIKRISADSKQGVKQYIAEVTIISQLRHKNLVKLTSWCHKKNDFLLIYEYMENGSLDSHLFRGESILAWQVRYNIALGLASALLYLQEEWEKCVLHRDIKSSNVMLDSNFNPKLGDFGLARLVDHDKGSETTDVAGTMGYLAPEYMNTGQARKESDIFSFGVVLLEIATGKKAIHHKHMEGEVSVVEWVWKLYELRNVIAAADENLGGEFDVQQMECLLVVGLWCANPDSASRPVIRQVINVLNSESSLPILPQQIPVQGCS
ncbi:L-type lectin-domain containing receptor kinase IX.1-like [Vigna unguiculata]|uniref:Serine/threonine-protein kinase PBS1 n=1 Tax=Vigna unguiculata TaxID=3917 RepID=A0A4D6L712_VIGUN|nr:L-type lectin-domain containing receptor kinase IX.1-like [Vigna unguiculata]QCD84201.1 serine/threonine-protein kinase PBS1 [Vigna unguiculata]QCD84204.1 serine/threonine-protein kinase PBS1 [Vigna unguiculata]